MHMSFIFLGKLLETIGTLLIAYAALKVSYRFRKEHKVDEKVFLEMKHEHYMGIAGMAFVTIGFILQAPYFWNI
jgi:hypothetical protein